MRTLIFALIFVVHLASASYEESIDEMLVQCNAFQSEIRFKNRTIHDCEKEDPDGDYSYHITSMVTRYSKRKFLCVLFFKDEFTQLDFKLLFSHGNFKINAYGIKFNKATGSQFASTVDFPKSVMVILPEKGAAELEILEWEINGEDQCPSCGEKNEKPQAVGLISGGTETEAANWPWHVSLWKRGGTGAEIIYSCGGAILNRKWIISAAHCMFTSGQIDSEKTLEIRLPTGKDITTNYVSYKVKLLIVHDGYNSSTFENDIALMKLDKTLDLTSRYRSICFSQLSNLPLAASGVAIGYGTTDRNKDLHSKVLREVEMPIFSQEECRDNDMMFFDNHLFEGNFCAGSPGRTMGVCAGDSGGGFYVRIRNSWYLQGLVSNTKKSEDQFNPTCNFETHALFTNVTFYTDWINKKILYN